MINSNSVIGFKHTLELISTNLIDIEAGGNGMWRVNIVYIKSALGHPAIYQLHDITFEAPAEVHSLLQYQSGSFESTDADSESLVYMEGASGGVRTTTAARPLFLDRSRKGCRLLREDRRRGNRDYCRGN